MPSIRLVTDIPGPRSQAVMKRRQAAVARGVSHATTIAVQSARGATVVDVDGNQLLDFAGGIGTMNVGHTDPTVTGAVHRQLDAFTHTCFAVALFDNYVTLAERLAALTPGRFPKKAVLVNSGAEAIENAVKIARCATGRPGVLCFEDAFHGRTLLTMSMTSKVVPYKSGFGPFVGDITRVPYGYCYRCPHELQYPECDFACVDRLEERFQCYVDPKTIAAVVVEPVLGEGGFVVPPIGYLARLAALCRKHGILVVADEIQTGFGRTGKLFACEHDGLEPDILVTAKSLAGGLPLAAVIGRAELMDAPVVGGLGGTYSGNPLACAAALAVLDLFESGELVRRAESIGARIEAAARRWHAANPLIGDIRRRGAMVGIELVEDPLSRKPAKEAANEVVRLACERGVILITAGTFGNVVRFLTPLVITDAELDEGLAVIGTCFEEAGLRLAASSQVVRPR